MRSINRTCFLALAAALVVGFQSTVHAGMSYLEIGYYNNFAMQVVAQGYSHNTYVTAFSANYVPGTINNVVSQPIPASHSDPFVTFCLDINTIIGNGWWQTASFGEVPLQQTFSGATRQYAGLYSAANLYRHFAGGVGHASGNGSTMVWDNKLEGAALQLAIWEVLYETSGSYNVNSGAGFYVAADIVGNNTAVRTRANDMLTAFGTPDYGLTTTFWNAVNSNGSSRSSQDLIGPMVPVPEPTTLIAGGLLLLPFLVSTLRRKLGR